MPTRNSRKTYVEDSYYHIYSRGSDKKHIFHEPEDYLFFMSLLKRYLSTENQKNKNGRLYPNYTKLIELNAFCLMPNHIHLLVYQKNATGIKQLMQSVMTSYSMFYNQKYEHFGPVFQSRYLASRINADNYLTHISRYIHLNPKNYLDYDYSSLQYYMNSKSAEWLNTKRVMNLFSNSTEYLKFINDYADHKAMLDELKYETAD